VIIEYAGGGRDVLYTHINVGLIFTQQQCMTSCVKPIAYHIFLNNGELATPLSICPLTMLFTYNFITLQNVFSIYQSC